MATNTLQQHAVSWDNPNKLPIIDSLTKESGILRTAETGFADKGLIQTYSKVTVLPTVGIRNINGSTTPTTSIEGTAQLDLKILTAEQEYDKRLVDNAPGGKGAFFNRKAPAFAEAFGQKAGQLLVYGTNGTFGDTTGFVGLHEIAKAYGNEINVAGATGYTNTIFAVHWKPEVNQIVIPDMSIMNMLEMTALGGGGVYNSVTNTTTNAAKPVYGYLWEMVMSLQMASKFSVARLHSICNYTGQTQTLPTATQVDQILDMVRASNDGYTFLYCNRDGRRALMNLKGTLYNTNTPNTDVNTMVGSWNGIPVIIEENILSTESNDLD